MIHVVLQRLIVIATDFEVVELLVPISVYMKGVDLLRIVLHPKNLSPPETLLALEQFEISALNLTLELPANEALESGGELVV